MAKYDQGGGCACGLSKFCDCRSALTKSVIKPDPATSLSSRDASKLDVDIITAAQARELVESHVDEREEVRRIAGQIRNAASRGLTEISIFTGWWKGFGHTTYYSDKLSRMKGALEQHGYKVQPTYDQNQLRGNQHGVKISW